MKISLILPSYNKGKYLSDTFNSLLRQRHFGPDEIILVDDDSTDDTKQVVKKYQSKFRNMKYIKLKKQSFIDKLTRKPVKYRNCSTAYNAGLRESSGDICVMCSAELIHGPDNMYLIKKEFEAIKDIFLIGSTVYFQQEFAYLLPWIKNEPERIEEQKNIIEYKDGMKTKDWDIIKHTNMESEIHCALRKNFFLVNGYDEDYDAWGHNDGDMKNRMMMMGLKKVKNNNIFSIHPWHDRPPKENVDKSTEQRLRCVNKTKEEMICRNGLLKI